jgi:hypothetical protein
MNAKTIVLRLIEANEPSSQFLDSKNSRTAQSSRKCRYHFNIGEGNYRCGLAFDIRASSRREAVVLANQFLQAYFYGGDHRGFLDLPTDGNKIAAAENLRVYVDDEILVTQRDIVTEDPVDDAS